MSFRDFSTPKSVVVSAAIGASVSLAFAPAYAQRDFSDVKITTEKVADGVYMLQGAGGNIGLSVGDDGAFVVDDQFAPLSERIIAAIGGVTKNPVAFVVNTHWHGDHTGGNENLGKTGAHIVAHENVRKRLKEGMKRANGRETPPAPDAALPVVTFQDSVTFHWNDQEIVAQHQGAAAHTDGDSIIYFRTANVVHMGDVFFNGGYPYIDLASGGDLDGYIATHEAVLAQIDDEAKIIPGHGALATKADLLATTAMLKDVRARIATLIADGKSEDEVVAVDPLNDLNGKWGQGFIKGEFMVRTAYNSLSKK